MAHFDVFNGDADGLCALVQLRNASPKESVLVTGVKRDIKLLDRVNANAGDTVTVLDVSMDKNKKGLMNALESGASVFYCDHHVAGDIPDNPKLEALINTDPNVCTSLLINGHLKGVFSEWAVTGAFGDNLNDSALAVAKPLALSAEQLDLLKNLGIYINYNGYGAALEDLHFYPDALFKELVTYASPFAFVSDNKATFEKLETGYHEDMKNAAAIKAEVEKSHAAVLMLPNAKWARRVSGVYSNDLTNQFPDRAHAVLTEKEDGDYVVSVRAPLSNKQGAAEICQQFDTGGGREAAAGINSLPPSDVERFISVFSAFYE